MTNRRDPGAAFPSIHYPPDRFVHTGLEDTADRMPERIAVTFEDEAYSFREIDALSNAMARVLVERGVRPAQRVGIMTMRRPEFVIVLFAVLKAGAALVSMNTAWKDLELAHSVELAEPSFVIHDATAQSLRACRRSARSPVWRPPSSPHGGRVRSPRAWRTSTLHRS